MALMCQLSVLPEHRRFRQWKDWKRVLLSAASALLMIYNELKECIPDTFEMVVIASNAQWQEYGDDDVIYLPLPLKAYDLVDTVSDLLTDIHRRLKREREKPNKRSSADQGVINQAKSLLMEKNGLTEEEAHRYLQKRSMDNGTNMVETAYMVLQVF